MYNNLQIIIANEAENDLENIYEFSIYNFGEELANLYIEKIQSKIKLISNNPNLGKNKLKNKKDIFSILCEKHIIFYKFTNTEIQILRVIHSARNLNKFYK